MKISSVFIGSVIAGVLSFNASGSESYELEQVNNNDYVRSLRIVADSNFDGRIYANGNMQARVNVLYSLVQEDDYVREIRLLKLYTKESIASFGWKTDVESNGYYHTISGSLESETLDAHPKEDHQYRYIRQSGIADIDVCVEIRTQNGHVADTCAGTSNQSYVSLSSITPVVYPIDNYSVTIEEHKMEGLGFEAKTVSVSNNSPLFPGVNNYRTRMLEQGQVNVNSHLLYNSLFCCDHGDFKHTTFNPYKPISGYVKYITTDTYVASGHQRHIDFKPADESRLIFRGLKLKFDAHSTPSAFNSMVYYENWTCQGPFAVGEVVNCWIPANSPTGAKIVGMYSDMIRSYHDARDNNTTATFVYVDNYGTEQHILMQLNTRGNVVIGSHTEF